MLFSTDGATDAEKQLMIETMAVLPESHLMSGKSTEYNDMEATQRLFFVANIRFVKAYLRIQKKLPSVEVNDAFVLGLFTAEKTLTGDHKLFDEDELNKHDCC